MVKNLHWRYRCPVCQVVRECSCAGDIPAQTRICTPCAHKISKGLAEAPPEALMTPAEMVSALRDLAVNRHDLTEEVTGLLLRSAKRIEDTLYIEARRSPAELGKALHDVIDEWEGYRG